MNLKPIWAVLFTVLISQVSLAQSPQGGGYEENKTELRVERPADAEEAIWSREDSLIFIPAHDVYGIWDTKNIHAYKEDLTKKADTTLITLRVNDCDFAHPYKGNITSDFGERGAKYHYGIDVKLQTGDSVNVVFEGVVRIAQYSRSYGNVVVVRHNNGLETLYAHLSARKVTPGDHVEAGDCIGLGGNTGRSTGSHLHFECRYKGEPLNPNDIIDWETFALKTDVLQLDQKAFAHLKEARAKKYHTIRRGDTLYGIARKRGTSVSKICKLNGISSKTTLRVGRKLRYR